MHGFCACALSSVWSFWRNVGGHRSLLEDKIASFSGKCRFLSGVFPAKMFNWMLPKLIRRSNEQCPSRKLSVSKIACDGKSRGIAREEAKVTRAQRWNFNESILFSTSMAKVTRSRVIKRAPHLFFTFSTKSMRNKRVWPRWRRKLWLVPTI